MSQRMDLCLEFPINPPRFILIPEIVWVLGCKLFHPTILNVDRCITTVGSILAFNTLFFIHHEVLVTFLTCLTIFPRGRSEPPCSQMTHSINFSPEISGIFSIPIQHFFDIATLSSIPSRRRHPSKKSVCLHRHDLNFCISTGSVRSCLSLRRFFSESHAWLKKTMYLEHPARVPTVLTNLSGCSSFAVSDPIFANVDFSLSVLVVLSLVLVQMRPHVDPPSAPHSWFP